MKNPGVELTNVRAPAQGKQVLKVLGSIQTLLLSIGYVVSVRQVCSNLPKTLTKTGTVIASSPCTSNYQAFIQYGSEVSLYYNF